MLLRGAQNRPLLPLKRQRPPRRRKRVPAEAGLVDIASILGAPTVTMVWSNL